MIIIVAAALVVPFLPFLGIMLLPTGRPALIGIGLAAAGVLLLAFSHGASRESLLVLVVLGVPVALAAAGQALLLKQEARLGPLIATGFCLIAALILILVLVGTS